MGPLTREPGLSVPDRRYNHRYCTLLQSEERLGISGERAKGGSCNSALGRKDTEYTRLD